MAKHCAPCRELDGDRALELLTDAANSDPSERCSFCGTLLVSAFGPLCHECQLAYLGQHEYLGIGLCLICGRSPSEPAVCDARTRAHVQTVLGRVHADS